MALIEVDLASTEVAHADDAAPQRVYADATAQEDAATGVLLVMRGTQVLAEFPKGRFVMWRVVAEQSGVQQSHQEERTSNDPPHTSEGG